MSPPPIIISLSGIDGAGKTTIARLLSRRVDGLYRKQTKGRLFSREINRLPIPHRAADYNSKTALAYSADFLAYATRRRPDHSLNRPIIYDRWKTCVRVFAQAFGNNRLEIDRHLEVIPEATVDFVLDIPVELALKRLQARGPLDYDETDEILSLLRAAYLDIAAQTNRLVLIDARSSTSLVIQQVTAHLSNLR